MPEKIREGVFRARSSIIRDGFVSGYCPFHDDRHPSASIMFRDGKPVRFTCFAGCGRGLPIRSFQILSDREISIRLGGKEDREENRPIALSPFVRQTARQVFRMPKKKKKDGKESVADVSLSRSISLVDPAAADELMTAVIVEVERIIEGRFREDAGAVRFWSSFMKIKRISGSWQDLPNRPLCGAGLYYRLHGIQNGRIVPLEEHVHIRLNADFRKSFFHRPFRWDHDTAPDSDGDRPSRIVPIYSPRGFALSIPHPPIVLVEAPQHAIRLAVLTEEVFPIAAMGISNLPGVFRALQEAGFAPGLVFADAHPGEGWSMGKVVVMDLDLVDDSVILGVIRAT